MIGTLNSEDREILDAAKRIIHQEIPRFVEERYFGSVPKELFRTLGENGIAGVTVGEQFGGLARGPLLLAHLMEEMASVNLGPAIFVSVHLMVCGIIEKFGTQEQKDRYLPAMARGDLLGAFALTEPAAGSDTAAMRAEAKVLGDAFLLSGEKCYITSAGWADVYVTFARTKDASGEGFSSFLIDADAPGLAISKPEKKMGCELSPIASLTFEEIKLPTTSLVGSLHKGRAVALSGLAGGRVNIAACANGLSRAAIDRAVLHLKEREQFGQKLAEFQGLQFMLADMKMQYEAARLLTLHAAERLHYLVPGQRENLFPSMSKCFATDAAMRITTDAVQLLGGAGYIREYVVEQLMRDAKMLQIVEGTNQIQRLRIARSVLEGEV